MSTSPLFWVHKNPTYTIQTQLDLDGNNPVTDIMGISPFVSDQLKQLHNISTIHDLVGYIMYNGFHRNIELSEGTKFILSLKCANKMMKWV